MFSFERQSKKFDPACKKRVVVLALCWIFGLFFGLFFVSSEGNFLTAAICSGSYRRASFIGLLAITLIPLCLSYVAFIRAKQPILYLICFFKAFAYGACLQAIVLVYGSASWLVRLLFLFSDSCSVVILLWFWYRRIFVGRFHCRKDFLTSVLIAFFLSMFDYFFVSPYLVKLMQNF